MKPLHALLYLCIAMMLISHISMGQKMMGPCRVKLLLNENQRGPSISVTIQCSILVGFKQCSMILEEGDASNPVIQKTTLWEGSSDSTINKQFIHQITLQEGSKARVAVYLNFSDLYGHAIGERGELYIHNTPKGIFTSTIEWGDLRWQELKKEAEEKGYKGMSTEQIREHDPELANQIKALSTSIGKPGPGSATPRPAPPTLEQVQEQNRRRRSNVTHEDSVKMQQAIPGTKGSDIKSAPRYLNVDSVRNKWIQEGRIRMIQR